MSTAPSAPTPQPKASAAEAGPIAAAAIPSSSAGGGVPREGSRDTDDGILVSIYPDVCLTPVGSSMVPVPYTIWAKQSDDANTTATVRFTKLRTHNMGSLITTCHGDEAGTGGGVKSGTHNGICEPKEHSATVRSEGKHVVRHNDIWWMNNKNTEGRLMYVKEPDNTRLTPHATKDWEVKAKPPEKEKTQAGNEAQSSPQPKDITQSNSVANADPRVNSATVISDAANASADMWKPGAQLAFNDTTGEYLKPGAALTPPAAPSSAPSGITPRALSGAAKGAGLIGAVSTLATWRGQRLLNQARQDIPTLNGEYGFSLNPENEADLHDVFEFEKDLDVRGATSDQAVDSLRKRVDKRRAKDGRTETPPPAGITEGNVNISGQKDKNRRRCPCIVGTYAKIQKECSSADCDGQAHHIVPDYTLRYGNRAEGMAGQKRIADMPSFEEGAAVCLDGMAKDDGSEHWEAHGADQIIKGLGANHSPVGTAPAGAVIDAATNQTVAVKAYDPACQVRIRDAANEAFAKVDRNALVRTTTELPTGDALGVLSGRSGGKRW